MTGGPAVIDRFTDTFARYIDSGFGLVHGEVAWLASTLIAIDITLAGLFWALSAEGEDVIARLIRKTLFIGVFALLITNWSHLAQVIFQSFSGLGLKASGATLGPDEFLHPGKLAQVGIDAGRPILDAIGRMSGFPAFFEHFVQIAILLIAWIVVIASFLILAIQLFVTLIEFKLTTLAGFVLVPFGLFNRTAFLAERTLGSVMASGVKVLVLAIIVGIGSTLFGEFTQGFPADPSLDDALTVVIGALTLLGLGIFGPGIAAGLGSGAPQLGAGTVVGTGLAAGGIAAAGAAAVRAMVGVAGAGGKALSGALMTSGRSGPGSSTGGAGPGGGSGPSGGGAPGTSPLRSAAPSSTATRKGTGEAASADTSAHSPSGTARGSDAPQAAGGGGSSAAAPAWARGLRRRQAMSHGAGMAAQALRSGDHHGAGSGVDLSEE